MVQAALKMVLEPIFEADFQPCSYGFRPKRRAQDAIAEIHFSTSRSYEWVVEGDIKACFDEISHSALWTGCEHRIGDKRVLGLVKAFLKAGILGEDGATRDTITGTPQGGILSPLLSNIALSVLDEHFAEAWEAMGDSARRASSVGARDWPPTASSAMRTILSSWWPAPEPTPRRLREEAAAVLLADGASPLGREDEDRPHRRGLRLPRLAHPAADASGARTKRFVYTYPSKKPPWRRSRPRCERSPAGSTNQSLSVLLHRLNPVLRGWTNYFRHGVSKATFNYLRAFTWRRVVLAAPQAPPGRLEASCAGAISGVVADGGRGELFNPATVAITATATGERASPRRGRRMTEGRRIDQLTWTRGEPDAWKSHVRFGGRAGETDRPKGRHRAPVRPPTASTSESTTR